LTSTSSLTVLVSTLVTVHQGEVGVLEQRGRPRPLRPPPPSHSQLQVWCQLLVVIEADGSDHVREADRPHQPQHRDVIDCHRVQSEPRMFDHPGNVDLQTRQSDRGREVGLAEDDAGEAEPRLTLVTVRGGDHV